MLKLNLNIPSEERQRILNLHENANRQYRPIKEQDETGKSEKEFRFPLKSVGKPNGINCKIDENKEVFCEWDNKFNKIPSIQEIGLPKFIPLDGETLAGVDEWEWLNGFNDSILKRSFPDFGLYVPSYDRNTKDLVFLRYDLERVKNTNGLSKTTGYLQADDNKFVIQNGMKFIVKGESLSPLGVKLPL